MSIVLISSLLYSCNNLSSNKNDIAIPNTTINFSTVDTSPSFKNCEKLIDREKTNCFRATIQEEFTKLLQQESFIAEKNIEEEVVVVLHIDREGEVSVKSIDSSSLIKTQLPKLAGNLKTMVTKLPKLAPAIKRGIPVSADYKLPILIKTSIKN